jgi:hypothetical protein
MNERIFDILVTISDFYTYDDDMAHNYISLINEVVELIDGLETKPNSMLDNVKSESLSELKNELANRMNEKSFFNSPIERKKSEFKISKTLVVFSIGKVVSNMLQESAAE